ncbi:MAG: hypothetical protein KatS3mg095_0842 [Candidatus Parcubacteria bacterium]|nr:MAG: hypothetical protein KatS3mg095_0842 [Candidatus Parcubacteria bacterium]
MAIRLINKIIMINSIRYTLFSFFLVKNSKIMDPNEKTNIKARKMSRRTSKNFIKL